MEYTVEQALKGIRQALLRADLKRLGRCLLVTAAVVLPLVATYAYLDAHPNMPPPSPQVVGKVLLGAVLVGVVFPLIRTIRKRNQR